uniref:Uncharacterized protein n=1 Tax=Octopus bimaculoides TaxID=37653 RepID=A0A0L8FZG8_OCTBM
MFIRIRQHRNTYSHRNTKGKHCIFVYIHFECVINFFFAFPHKYYLNREFSGFLLHSVIYFTCSQSHY